LKAVLHAVYLAQRLLYFFVIQLGVGFFKKADRSSERIEERKISGTTGNIICSIL
jgi:hypothetical protein